MFSINKGDEVLDHKKSEFAKQSKETSRARNMIDTLEEQSKYFAVGSKMEEEERNYTRGG